MTATFSAWAMPLATTASGGVSLVADDEAVRQSLIMLLSTVPGERVMRPDYGCPLHRLVFEPLDETTAGLAMHWVEQAVRRFEPRVEILTVDAQPSADTENSLTVRLDYRVLTTRRSDVLELDVALAGPTVGDRR